MPRAKAPSRRRPCPVTPPQAADDVLTRALWEALATEADPDVRQWIELLLRGDERSGFDLSGLPDPLRPRLHAPPTDGEGVSL